MSADELLAGFDSPQIERATIMNTNHTPSPWSHDPKTDSVYSKANHSLICKIATGENRAEEDMNAALIAAAPALLEFAKEMRGYLDLKLIGFRQDYPENHCIVDTAKRYLAQCDAILAKLV